MMTLDHEPLLTRRHLAQLLSVTPRTIQRWEKLGLPVEHIGDLPRYRYSEVMDWIKKTEQISI